MGITHQLRSSAVGNLLLNGDFLDDKLYAERKRDDLFQKHPERAVIPDKYFSPDRYRAEAAYNWNATPQLDFVGEYNRLSDEAYRKDFFYNEYETEPHPMNYLLTSYALGRSSFSLLTQGAVNPFFTETEYLPQLSYDVYRQSLLGSNFYFQSQTALGELGHHTAYSTVVDDFRAERAHSHNDLSYVQNFGIVRVTPYAGAYTTYYSQELDRERDVFRFAPETGVNFSSKFFKPLDWRGNFLGENIEKMRHILTPSIDYNYIRTPTVQGPRLYQFDSIDALARQEKVVFTLENKLQAKTSARTWDLLYFAPSAEYHIDDEGLGSHLDNVQSTLEFYPRPNFSFDNKIIYNCANHYLQEFDADFNFKDPGPNARYHIAMGNSYVHSDTSQGILDCAYKITPKLELSSYIRYEYKGAHFQEQQYKLRTDLHCWWLDICLDVARKGVMTLWFKLTLKDFPGIHFGFDHNYQGAKHEY